MPLSVHLNSLILPLFFALCTGSKSWNAYNTKSSLLLSKRSNHLNLLTSVSSLTFNLLAQPALFLLSPSYPILALPGLNSSTAHSVLHLLASGTRCPRTFDLTVSPLSLHLHMSLLLSLSLTPLFCLNSNLTSFSSHFLLSNLSLQPPHSRNSTFAFPLTSD